MGRRISKPGSWFYKLAGQVVAPILSRGQNIANLKVAKANQTKALNTFEYTVLSASADVSNAYVALRASKSKQIYLMEQVENLEKAVEYNKDLLSLSTTTYLEVLTAQQSLLNAQIQMLNNELNVNKAAISLYQSL